MKVPTNLNEFLETNRHNWNSILVDDNDFIQRAGSNLPINLDFSPMKIKFVSIKAHKKNRRYGILFKKNKMSLIR